MFKIFVHVLLLFYLITIQVYAVAGSVKPQPLNSMNIHFEGTLTASDFPTSSDWLNTDRALSLKDLRGKIVLLDFWTYCCINCIHVIPDLKKLEAKYPNELVVIGVHSAKFSNEKETENIRAAINRYEIEHPVLNDDDFVTWRAYNVRAWPTLVLINPHGKVIGMHSGEGIYEPFDAIIKETIAYFDKKGELNRTPLQFTLEKEVRDQQVLSYPGKIAVDRNQKRLALSDSNHNRILLLWLDGKVEKVIGSRKIGLKDGNFEEAQFSRPQGIAWDESGKHIYVADTENHAIRQIDLEKQRVSTLAGTGSQARSFNQEGKGVALNSPWDLLLQGDKLFIAMAGSHQLWSLDLKTLAAHVHAGSGREDIIDGSLRQAALAQPSGITSSGDKIYFADSEVSALRSAAIELNGKVQTLVGEGLFEFGDVDGKFPYARLQHPLGVVWYQDEIYIADTYNHKIKVFDPKTKELKTWIGTGKRGHVDDFFTQATLNEPSGLAFAGNRIYIADCNNHLIRVGDLQSGKLSTLLLQMPSDAIAQKQK